jgi:arylformamidase
LAPGGKILDLSKFRVFDISPIIRPEIGVFPGDTPFRRTVLLDMKKGAGFTLSKIETTVHLGAHTDAPNHYATQGASMQERSLNYYLGSAQVIEVKGCRGRRILPADLKSPIQAPRVLFKTGSFPDPYQWNSDFAALSAELIDHLAARGVKLVGIDTPSIDPESDKVLESHEAVFRNDMAILEGIVLDGVAEGSYQLIALPLRMEGADATPVRAILLGG